MTLVHKNIIILLVCVLPTLTFSQRIGFCMDDFLADRWRQDSTVFVETAQKFNEQVTVKISNSNTELQIKQGKELIDQGIEVLVIVATDGYSLKSLVSYANKKKVKVIAYDRLIYNAKIDYYVSFDNVKIGELQADYITKLIPKGNYILINGPKFDPNANMFLEGQMNVLKSHIKSGDINVILNKQMHEWTSMEAFLETSNFLASFHDSIDAVIVANDGMAEGVIDALQMFGHPLVPVTGQDAEVKACQRIIQNKQIITIYKPIDVLAKSTAELAVSLLKKEQSNLKFESINNGSVNVPYLKLAPTLIHKQNLKQELIDTGILNKDLLAEEE